MEKTLDFKKVKSNDKAFNILRLILVYGFLSLGAIAVIFPFYWMILTSIKSYSSFLNEDVPRFIAISPTFQNYSTAWNSVKLGQYMLNTTIYALVTTVLMLIMCLLAAYAFARLKFRGKNIVFTIFLATMMIPNELVIITNYYTVRNLGWDNSFTGLILPSVLSVFYIYLLRQNFMQIPDGMYYAAKLDGTTDLKYLYKMVLPLSKPTLISITILKLIECWNSFIWPRLITTDENYYLVSNGIQEIRYSGFGRENIPAMMAAVVCVSLPLLILFVIFRKQIMAGVSRSGLKG